MSNKALRYSQKLAQPQVNYVSSVMTSEASIMISERLKKKKNNLKVHIKEKLKKIYSTYSKNCSIRHLS